MVTRNAFYTNALGSGGAGGKKARNKACLYQTWPHLQAKGGGREGSDCCATIPQILRLTCSTFEMCDVIFFVFFFVSYVRSFFHETVRTVLAPDDTLGEEPCSPRVRQHSSPSSIALGSSSVFGRSRAAAPSPPAHPLHPQNGEHDRTVPLANPAPHGQQPCLIRPEALFNTAGGDGKRVGRVFCSFQVRLFVDGYPGGAHRRVGRRPIRTPTAPLRTAVSQPFLAPMRTCR